MRPGNRPCRGANATGSVARVPLGVTIRIAGTVAFAFAYAASVGSVGIRGGVV
jgi:hypothetical protein